MRTKPGTLTLLALACAAISLPPPARAEGGGDTGGGKPMSAIQWLSKSVTAPVAPKGLGPRPGDGQSAPGQAPGLGSAPATGPATGQTQGTEPETGPGPGVLPPPVTTSVLRKGPALDAVGLLAVKTTGLPRDMWGNTPTGTLVQMIRHFNIDTLPALQQLFTKMILSEVEAPDDSVGDGRLLLARVDRLLDLGALDQAQGLLEQAGTDRPDIFRRWFDVALLLGDENRACAQMKASPDVSPTFPARIFCLARNGDWNAAALTLQTAKALGFVKGDMADLLERFLDPALEEDSDPLPPPARPSPLVWRMMEAIGEPLPTNTLPLAFAQADLRENIGWKSQLDAAERLARTGAIRPRRLFDLYRKHQASASGGVWDRVARVHLLDDAIRRDDVGSVDMVLPATVRAMGKARLEVPFADIYAAKLAKLPLDARGKRIAFTLALLSEQDVTLAKTLKPANKTEAFLAGIARGVGTQGTPPGPLGAAVAAAFATPPPVPEDLARLADNRQVGAALLEAMNRIRLGTKGDLSGVTGGLALLRKVGQERVARQAALELLLLDRKD